MSLMNCFPVSQLHVGVQDHVDKSTNLGLQQGRRLLAKPLPLPEDALQHGKDSGLHQDRSHVAAVVVVVFVVKDADLRQSRRRS